MLLQHTRNSRVLPFDVNGRCSVGVNNFVCSFAMENYILYEELPACAQGCVHYKGRRRRSIHFVSIEKCDKARKDAVANSVRSSRFSDRCMVHV